jgi:RNA polymerase sigma-70 factor (ECF subfamily)
MDIALAEPGIDCRIEPVFQTYYAALTRVIAGILRDPARAEELAVEVLLRWSERNKADDSNLGGWLHRTAVTTALDELRRRARRRHYEWLSWFGKRQPTPEDQANERQQQQCVRLVLGILPRRQSLLLLLRSQGMSYDELAAAIGVSPGSVGTLLIRAQKAFRKEYVKRYGEQ